MQARVHQQVLSLYRPISSGKKETYQPLSRKARIIFRYTALMLLCVTAFPILPSVTFAQQPTPFSVVIGQNNPEVDVQAVQTAVDRGGTVVLLGTFHFGPTGRVTLSTDVVIKGAGRTLPFDLDPDLERYDIPRTKILGGDIPFFNREHAISVTIRDLWFDGPTSMAISLTAAQGHTHILGNRITSVREGIHPATGSPVAGGMNLSNVLRWAEAEGPGYSIIPDNFNPDRHLTFTGEVLIQGNYIDLDPEGIFHYDFLRAVGIESTQTVAQTTIADNVVKNTSHAGILVTDNFKSHLIKNNVVTIHDYPDGKQVLFPTGSSFGAEGIVIVGVFFIPLDEAASLIVGNTIQTGGEAAAEQRGGAGPAALGIMLNGPHLALDNHVIMDGGYAPLFIWTRPRILLNATFPGLLPPGDSTDAFFMGNTVEGEALFLATAAGRRDLQESVDQAAENILVIHHSERIDFRATNAEGCDIFFPEYTHNNIVVVDDESSSVFCDDGANFYLPLPMVWN